MKALKREDLFKYMSEEDSQVFALCIIDLDFFKRYIDFHGQLEGNSCLEKVVNCLESVMSNRKGFLTHFSGDKFICFLTDLKAEDFANLVETMREAVENLNLKFCWQQHSFQVTISVGGVHGKVSQFKDKEEMFTIADEELLQAKSKGYNNVQIKYK